MVVRGWSWLGGYGKREDFGLLGGLRIVDRFEKAFGRLLRCFGEAERSRAKF